MNYKSPVVDSITNEQLKYGEEGLLEQLFAIVWRSEKIPSDCLKEAIIAICV